jgi:hypothetical protein
MITRCTTTGEYADRLRVGSAYTIYAIDLDRMRIRIDDLTGAFNWYPAELFEVDLVGMSQGDTEQVRMRGTRFKLFTTRDSFGEAYRAGVSATKWLIVDLLDARGMDPSDYSIGGLLQQMRDVLNDSVYCEGHSAQFTIEACHRRLTRILWWLERMTPEVVTIDELAQCSRVTRRLHGRWTEARHRLAGFYGIDLSQPRR